MSKDTPMSNAAESEHRQTAKRDAIPALEWIISGLGLTLVTASLGFLLHKAILVECKPPDMQAQLLSSRTGLHGYIATVELKNTGGQTAANLQVLAQLVSPQGEFEREATVDFLPPHSTRQIELYFQQPPTKENLQVQFLSYHIP